MASTVIWCELELAFRPPLIQAYAPQPPPPSPPHPPPSPPPPQSPPYPPNPPPRQVVELLLSDESQCNVNPKKAQHSYHTSYCRPRKWFIFWTLCFGTCVVRVTTLSWTTIAVLATFFGTIWHTHLCDFATNKSFIAVNVRITSF